MATKRSPAAPASPISLKLDGEERARLNTLAVARKRSSHYLMREYLTREEARQSFRDDAAMAWRDYKDTGRHATQAELDGWIDSLGTRRPKPAPEWPR